jgi:hypothetical protein
MNYELRKTAETESTIKVKIIFMEWFLLFLGFIVNYLGTVHSSHADVV